MPAAGESEASREQIRHAEPAAFLCTLVGGRGRSAVRAGAAVKRLTSGGKWIILR